MCEDLTKSIWWFICHVSSRTASDVAYQNRFFLSFQRQIGTCYCLLQQLQIPCNISLELSLTTKSQTSLCCGAGGCAHKDTGITVTWSGACGPLTPPSCWDRRITRYGTWWIQPSLRSFTPALSPRLLFPACHHSTFYQTDSFICFYVFLIEPESRVKVKCTFHPTLTLCRITEAEPFSLALDTFSRSSRKNAHTASGVSGGRRGWDPSLARRTLFRSKGRHALCIVSAMKLLIHTIVRLSTVQPIVSPQSGVLSSQEETKGSTRSSNCDIIECAVIDFLVSPLFCR